MRSGREGLILFYCFDRFFGGNTFGIPGNTLRENLFHVFCEILEDLVIGVDPFDLFWVPVNCVSSR
jgi:hypothetical protein